MAQLVICGRLCLGGFNGAAAAAARRLHGLAQGTATDKHCQYKRALQQARARTEAVGLGLHAFELLLGLSVGVAAARGLRVEGGVGEVAADDKHGGDGGSSHI